MCGRTRWPTCWPSAASAKTPRPSSSCSAPSSACWAGARARSGWPRPRPRCSRRPAAWRPAPSGAGAAALAASATGHFVTFLETETHEGSLVLALEQLAAWAARYTNSLPAQLVLWLPKGLALRSTTSPVRPPHQHPRLGPRPHPRPLPGRGQRRQAACALLCSTGPARPLTMEINMLIFSLLSIRSDRRAGARETNASKELRPDHLPLQAFQLGPAPPPPDR